MPLDTSGPLTRSDGGQGFAQQGSVDWVSLSGGIFSFSMGMLQRLSGSNLDICTLRIGHILGSRFRLSRKGRSSIMKAIDDMKVYAGLQDVLWFGFGMKHPVRVISATEQGTTLVALCAALAECFPYETAAEILHEIVILESNLDVTPSVREWLAIVEACAGILSSTVFPLRAQNLMGLGTEGAPADSKDIAQVLSAIAKITRLECVSITIHGAKEARWIGALSEWLFGLTVTIINNEDEVVYTNCPEKETSQVNICCSSRLCPSDNDSDNDYRYKGVGKSLTIADKTFYIEGHYSVVYRKPTNATIMDTPIMNGRVSWDSCLSTVFGSAFSGLMKHPSRVGDVISSVARVFGAIAGAEEGVPLGVMESNIHYMDSSFDTGLFDTLLRWFPELLEIKPHLMQGPDIQTYKSALKKYRTSLNAIRRDCDCARCVENPPRNVHDSDPKCQVVLMELIIQLGRLLSATECADGLCPKFTGLRKLYNIRGNELRDNGGKYMDPPGVHRYRLLYAHPPKLAPKITVDTFQAHMDQALCLFTGRTASELRVDFTSSPAISVEGICIYLEILREIPDILPMFAMIHVCPGKIMHRDNVYSQITDQGAHLKESGTVGYRQECIAVCAFQGILTSVKLALRESVNRLFLHYDLFNYDGTEAGMQLAPFDLSQRMLYNYRRLSCNHSGDSDTDWGDGPGWVLPFPEIRCNTDPENKFKTCSIESSFLGRCAIVGLQAHILAPNSLVVVHDGECMSCCRQIWANTREIYKGEEIFIVSKPDPHRPPWSGLKV